MISRIRLAVSDGVLPTFTPTASRASCVAAAFIKENVTKPVVGYVAGFTAPEGKTMGHAGAIVSGSSGTAAAKQEALESVGVGVGGTPTETARLVLDRLGVEA